MGDLCLRGGCLARSCHCCHGCLQWALVVVYDSKIWLDELVRRVHRVVWVGRYRGRRHWGRKFVISSDFPPGWASYLLWILCPKPLVPARVELLWWWSSCLLPPWITLSLLGLVLGAAMLLVLPLIWGPWLATVLLL